MSDRFQPTKLTRRSFVNFAVTACLMSSTSVRALTISQSLPWTPSSATPPTQVLPGPWVFFTPIEALLIEAIVDRLIPADQNSLGGKDAGCAVFIDRQLAGPFGNADGLYMSAPFLTGVSTQGFQADASPATRYRAALKSIADYVEKNFAGKAFYQLATADQDRILSGLETGSLRLDGADATGFFSLLLQNTQEGYFADPVYGGNRDMEGWKLIGFPGARYDYRDWVERHNEAYPLPPVSIMGRAEWAVK